MVDFFMYAKFSDVILRKNEVGDGDLHLRLGIGVTLLRGLEPSPNDSIRLSNVSCLFDKTSAKKIAQKTNSPKRTDVFFLVPFFRSSVKSTRNSI